MDWKSSLFLITIYLVFVSGNDDGDPKHSKAVVCVLASWAMYRKPPLDFNMSNIDPKLCTHIVYAHAGLDEKSNTIKSIHSLLDVEDDGTRAGYKNLTEIKKDHPHVKFTLSIGGWNEGSLKYSKMAAEKWKRTKFIRSVIQYLEKFEFDGLDIMWKHPTKRGGMPEDKENYVTLIKELKEAFLPYGYILTATLANVREIMSSAYDLVNLNRYLDQIYLDAYDYYGPWSEIVGPLSPLKGLSKQDEKNVEYTIKYMLSFGVSPEKLILGIPFYGRTFILTEPDVNDIKFGETVSAHIGFNGPYLNGTNAYAYNEICLDIKNGSIWSYHWDNASSTPYLRDGSRVISYDNTRSIANKVKLALDYRLGGFMAWSIDKDDYKGYCDMPNDTYTDFIERYNILANDNSLQEALKDVDFYKSDDGATLRWNGFKDLREKIVGKQQKFANYPLLRTIHQAIDVVLEEQMIAETTEQAKKNLQDMKNKGSVEQSRNMTGIPCVRICSEMCFYGTNF